LNTSPGIPTENGEYNPQYDEKTVTLTDYLNAVVDQVPTSRHTQRANVITNSDVGILPDTSYNVGYHMKIFDNNDVHIISRFESPDVPVTHIPFNNALKNSTYTQNQVTPPIPLNLRAPSINEGY